MKSALRYTVMSVRHGQPGPYRDSEDVVHILVESNQWCGGAEYTDTYKPYEHLTPAFAKEIGRKFLGWSDNPVFLETRLKHVKIIGTGLIEVHTISPYND